MSGSITLTPIWPSNSPIYLWKETKSIARSKRIALCTFEQDTSLMTPNEMPWLSGEEMCSRVRSVRDEG